MISDFDVKQFVQFNARTGEPTVIGFYLYPAVFPRMRVSVEYLLAPFGDETSTTIDEDEP